MKRFPFAVILALPTLAHEETEDDVVARGASLATAMDSAGCHMPRGSDGAPVLDAGLSGGTVRFEIPGMSIFWVPNLTPSDTGLGFWSDEEIAAAITIGQRPDGRTLAPAMPWPSYAALTGEDVDGLRLPTIFASRGRPEDRSGIRVGRGGCTLLQRHRALICSN